MSPFNNPSEPPAEARQFHVERSRILGVESSPALGATVGRQRPQIIVALLAIHDSRTHEEASSLVILVGVDVTFEDVIAKPIVIRTV
jgi:hypothetical protein